MVINENSECVNIFEMLSLCVVTIANSVHRLMTSENVRDCEIHWIVKHTGEIVLIRANIGGITVEALSHLENSC